MTLKRTELIINTVGPSLINITDEVNKITAAFSMSDGLCNLFLVHTSASLIFCENYDPDVLHDLENFMSRLVPADDPLYRHVAEGSDDMPAHIKTVLTQNSLIIPVSQGKLSLGTWQGIFLWEHRNNTHSRKIIISLFS